MMRDFTPLMKSSPDSLISLSSQSRQLTSSDPMVASLYVKLSLSLVIVSLFIVVGSGDGGEKTHRKSSPAPEVN